MSREIRLYRAASGVAPFEEWLDGLRDLSGRARIRARLDRVAQGNLGDHRAVGGGVLELRVHHGPGYRLYVGLYGQEIVVLLGGGVKDTQEGDILAARRYREDYERRA